jgi:ferredoxin
MACATISRWLRVCCPIPLSSLYRQPGPRAGGSPMDRETYEQFRERYEQFRRKFLFPKRTRYLRTQPRPEGIPASTVTEVYKYMGCHTIVGVTTCNGISCSACRVIVLICRERISGTEVLA